ncbi:hypothetical protein NMG60_11024397 [Bertholletia excelsa]
MEEICFISFEGVMMRSKCLQSFGIHNRVHLEKEERECCGIVASIDIFLQRRKR